MQTSKYLEQSNGYRPVQCVICWVIFHKLVFNYVKVPKYKRYSSFGRTRGVWWFWKSIKIVVKKICNLKKIQNLFESTYKIIKMYNIIDRFAFISRSCYTFLDFIAFSACTKFGRFSFILFTLLKKSFLIKYFLFNCFVIYIILFLF